MSFIYCYTSTLSSIHWIFRLAYLSTSLSLSLSFHFVIWSLVTFIKLKKKKTWVYQSPSYPIWLRWMYLPFVWWNWRWCLTLLSSLSKLWNWRWSIYSLGFHLFSLSNPLSLPSECLAQQGLVWVDELKIELSKTNEFELDPRSWALPHNPPLSLNHLKTFPRLENPSHYHILLYLHSNWKKGFECMVESMFISGAKATFKDSQLTCFKKTSKQCCLKSKSLDHVSPGFVSLSFNCALLQK